MRHILMALVLALAMHGLDARAEKATEEDTRIFLLPEWMAQGILTVVWPEHMRAPRHAEEVLHAILQHTPDDLQIAIISPRPPSRKALGEISRPLRYVPMPNVRSLAIRDWAAAPSVTPESKAASLKFNHATRGHAGMDADDCRMNHRTGLLLADTLMQRRVDIPLVMDGRSMTHNGRGLVLLSNRVIADNEHLSVEEIKQTISDTTFVEEIHFLPVPPDEAAGHITGWMRFVDEDKLLFSYPAPDTGRHHAYAERLHALLKEILPETISLIPVPASDLPGYVDMLQIGKILFIPQYNRADDDHAVTALKEALPGHTIIPVPLQNTGLSLNALGVVY